MKKFISVILCFMLYLGFFPQIVNAQPYQGIRLKLFFSADEEDHRKFEFLEFCFVAKFSTQEMAFMLFDNYRLQEISTLKLFPDGTRLLSAEIFQGELILDFSKEFLNYGGTARELHIIKMLAKTAFEFEEVQELTILIEGESVCLSEGSFVKNKKLGVILNESFGWAELE